METGVNIWCTVGPHLTAIFFLIHRAWMAKYLKTTEIFVQLN